MGSGLRRFLSTWRYWDACADFLSDGSLGISLRQRYEVIKKLYQIHFAFRGVPHVQRQILVFVRAILRAPRNTDGVIVEAGCFKGISSAKFSYVASLAGKKLVIFDSFEGLPENDEPHEFGVMGRPITFEQGDYAASLDEVRANVRQHGEIGVCEFVKGWFSETLPDFKTPIAAAYVDVDLVSSTRECLRCFWPLLEPGGLIYSQDAHVPLVVELIEDERFWREELGCTEMPAIRRLEKEMLLEIAKPR